MFSSVEEHALVILIFPALQIMTPLFTDDLEPYSHSLFTVIFAASLGGFNALRTSPSYLCLQFLWPPYLRVSLPARHPHSWSWVSPTTSVSCLKSSALILLPFTSDHNLLVLMNSRCVHIFRALTVTFLFLNRVHVIICHFPTLLKTFNSFNRLSSPTATQPNFNLPPVPAPMTFSVHWKKLLNRAARCHYPPMVSNLRWALTGPWW